MSGHVGGVVQTRGAANYLSLPVDSAFHIYDVSVHDDEEDIDALSSNAASISVFVIVIRYYRRSCCCRYCCCTLFIAVVALSRELSFHFRLTP